MMMLSHFVDDLPDLTFKCTSTGSRKASYLNLLRHPLKVPLHHLHGLRGDFFQVSVHLESGDREVVD